VATAIWLFVVLPIYYGGIMLATLKDLASFGTPISAVIALLAYLANPEKPKRSRAAEGLLRLRKNGP
jgi:hypothetical protein